jgi:DNA-binding LytR/AlgR family response regulator
MHTLTVTRDADGESGIYNIACDIVNYMEGESDKKRVIVHTPYEFYYMMGTLKYWSVVLNASGYKFMDVDRNVLVNVENIILLNRTTKEAFFDNEILKNSMRCGIAFHKYSKYEKIILSFNPRITIV